MTNQDFLTWLKKPSAQRVVLVECVANVGGVEIIRYLSTLNYNTGPNDSPANQHYQPIVSTGISFTEQLSLTAQVNLAAGDIEIQNYNGVRDSWLSDVWMNRSIKVYVGDMSWRRGDFQMIFNGTVADITPKSRDTLALKIRDKLQLLNMPLSELTVGGTVTNKDAYIPICFGEVHNITPILSNPATLEYQVHTSALEQIIEVRDNGLPIAFTPNAATGKFTLQSAPAGVITVSAQGDNGLGYVNTAAQLIRRIVTSFGNGATRFTDADIDLVNFAAFDAAHPQPMGIYFSDRVNVLAACQQIAASIGAQMVMSRTGQLRLYQITLPAVPTADIYPRHMLERSLTPKSRTDVIAGVKLGFCKCWTVQNNLQTALPPEHKSLYATEWLTTSVSDTTVQASYKLDATVAQQNTMLLCKVDADVEVARQLVMWKVPRTVYEFEGVPEMLSLQLGQGVTVHSNRFGMQNGVPAVVISLQPNWLNGHVKVGFVV